MKEYHISDSADGREHLLAVLREIEARVHYQGKDSAIGMYLERLSFKMGYELSMAVHHWNAFKNKYDCKILYEGEMETSSRFQISIKSRIGSSAGLALAYEGIGIEN